MFELADHAIVMTDAAHDISGLPEGAPADRRPAEFRAGVYRLRGKSRSRGVYRSGKWQGRPYARFVFELQDGDMRRQVSQMLPWVPGVAFFETNFRLITGMSFNDFKARCATDGLDSNERSALFMRLFCGAEYEAEVKQQDRWLNVWRLRKRFDDVPVSPGEPAESDEPGPGRQPLPASAADVPPEPSPGPGEPSPTPALVQPATETIDPEAELDAGVRQLAGQLGLDAAALDALTDEEFSVAYTDLSAADKLVLLSLLEERQAFESPGDEG